MQLVKEKNYSESMFENENDDYINDEILIEVHFYFMHIEILYNLVVLCI